MEKIPYEKLVESLVMVGQTPTVEKFSILLLELLA